LIRPIGDGGMATIWNAIDVQLGRAVAVKIVPARRDSELRARFLREASVIRQFSHRNVVAVVDAGELLDEGLLFLAMELLHGSPLSNHLRPGRPLPAREILPVLIEVCHGLEAAHGAGVIHRDIKPENVFLAIVPGAGVVPKILDFGLSTTGGSPMAPRITADGQVLGTPAYMSAEQAMARSDLTPATDLWSMGVILYEAVSGKLPFFGVNPGVLLDAIVREEPAAIPAAVDARTRAIIARCLQKDPAQRYPDAAALRADLETALEALGNEPGYRSSLVDDEDPSSSLRLGGLADPVQVAAEPPITRTSRQQRQALARPKSPLLIVPFAIALCALAVWAVPGRHAAAVRLDTGVARAARSRAAVVHRHLRGEPPPRPRTRVP
jgi:serine/threonine-protein kinase